MSKYMTQSLTKELGFFVVEEDIEEQPICPYQFYKKNISKEVKKPPSEPMALGLKLEQGTLGASAKDDKYEIEKDKRTGKPRAKERRVDEHILAFPAMANREQIVVYKDFNTQVGITKHYRDEWYVHGTLDIFPTTKLSKVGNKPKMVNAIIDQKATGNINNKWFSENNLMSSISCYGNPKFLAKNQGLIYKWLTQDIDPELNQHLFDDYGWNKEFLQKINQIDFMFYLMVHDLSKDISESDDKVRFFLMKWNERREQLLYKLLDMSIQAYEYYEKEGWKPNPSNEKRCAECPLTELQCPHKNKEEAF